MARDKRDQRIPLMMSAAELRAVDNWRFKNQIGSRSEAIRQLIANRPSLPPPFIMEGYRASLTKARKTIAEIDSGHRQWTGVGNQPLVDTTAEWRADAEADIELFEGLIAYYESLGVHIPLPLDEDSQ